MGYLGSNLSFSFEVSTFDLQMHEYKRKGNNKAAKSLPKANLFETAECYKKQEKKEKKKRYPQLTQVQSSSRAEQKNANRFAADQWRIRRKKQWGMHTCLVNLFYSRPTLIRDTNYKRSSTIAQQVDQSLLNLFLIQKQQCKKLIRILDLLQASNL